MVDSEHFKNHGMYPMPIVKLYCLEPLVDIYCVFCRQPVGKENVGSPLSPRLVKKLSKHFPSCFAESAEGWSDEAGRLIEYFLLKHLFSRPRDRLRISVNLPQAETIRDIGLQR
ncbi:MAG: hypothetical protein QXY54_06130 [Nitrososphaerota archaeon]